MSDNPARLQPISDGNVSLHPESSFIDNSLMHKDRWDGEKDLGMRVNQHLQQKTLNFGVIKQPWLKDAAKRYILYRRVQGKKFSTLLENKNRIQRFAKFLASQYVRGFEDISSSVLESYIVSLNRLSKTTQNTQIIYVKTFLNTGTINGWFNVSTYILAKKTYTIKPNHNKIRYIPDEVLRQLDEHLHLLPDPVQRMVVLIRALGLRAGELLQLRFDCLRQHRDGEWSIQFICWKFNQRLDTLPINKILVKLIKEQQEYVRAHLGNEFPYLFSGNKKGGIKQRRELFGFEPNPRVMSINSYVRYLNRLAEHCNMCDAAGNRWHFTSHQFRKTVATKMTNEGVRQYVIQMYLRHRSPDMMLHYAYVLPATIKKEIDALHKQKKIVDITGAEVEILRPELDNDIGWQWLLSNMQPLALAMGFCARPALQKPCPHANACMSCKHYRLDTDDLPALYQHLDCTRKLKAESERLGYVRQIKGIEQDEAKLTNLVKSLES